MLSVSCVCVCVFMCVTTIKKTYVTKNHIYLNMYIFINEKNNCRVVVISYPNAFAKFEVKYLFLDIRSGRIFQKTYHDVDGTFVNDKYSKDNYSNVFKGCLVAAERSYSIMANNDNNAVSSKDGNITVKTVSGDKNCTVEMTFKQHNMGVAGYGLGNPNVSEGLLLDLRTRLREYARDDYTPQQIRELVDRIAREVRSRFQQDLNRAVQEIVDETETPRGGEGRHVMESGTVGNGSESRRTGEPNPPVPSPSRDPNNQLTITPIGPPPSLTADPNNIPTIAPPGLTADPNNPPTITPPGPPGGQGTGETGGRHRRNRAPFSAANIPMDVNHKGQRFARPLDEQENISINGFVASNPKSGRGLLTNDFFD